MLYQVHYTGYYTIDADNIEAAIESHRDDSSVLEDTYTNTIAVSLTTGLIKEGEEEP